MKVVTTQKNTESLIKTECTSQSPSLSIFKKFIKNKYKLIPFKVKFINSGETKYFPPFSKEWNNSIYVFNLNNLKNLPLYNININTLIRHYFNLYFNHEFINNNYESPRIRRLSLNKIFVSKAEIKHTNSKATITIYTYNREKLVLLKKLKKIKKLFYKNLLSVFFKVDKLSQERLHLKTILTLLHKELILFRRFKLKLSLNKYKFEEKFLYKLSKLISNFYNKKVEFNLINMKSIVLNSDFFTKILSLKLKSRNSKIMRLINIIINKAKLPARNAIVENSLTIKNINTDLIDNKYRNLNLNFILGKPTKGRGYIKATPASSKFKLEDNVFNNLYFNFETEKRHRYASILSKLLVMWKNKRSPKIKYLPGWKNSIINSYIVRKLSQIIFNSIKYKNMGGIRLEIKGRLTKRYRADRALFKVKWKGGLKNRDSSYKGLSSVNLRGFTKPNVEYSIYTSKRRIGAFAVKGWISGK